MSASGSADPLKITVNGATYDLAIERGGRIAHTVTSRGADLRWERDFRSGSSGMGETVAQSANGDFFTDNMDTTKRGLRLGPTKTTITLTDSIPACQGYWFFENRDSASTRYVYFTRKKDADEVVVSKIIPSTNLEATTAVNQPQYFQVAGATNIDAGRPDRHNGSWFHCLHTEGANAGTLAIQQLVSSAVGDADDDWDPHGTSFANAGVSVLFYVDAIEGNAPKFARILAGGAQVSTVSQTTAAAVLVEANWATAGVIGDISYICRNATSHAGLSFISRADNLHAWDPSGNSYGVVPGIGTLATATVGGGGALGLGLVPYGDRVFYSRASNLWQVIGTSSAKNISVDQLSYYTSAPNITAPIRLRYLEGTALGDWVYWAYSATETGGSSSYILAMHYERSKVSGQPVTWYTIAQESAQIRGMFIDSEQRLWYGLQGAATVKWLQLALDGSPDASVRGNISSTYEWYGPEIDATHFGLNTPEITLQYRYAFVEIEGGTANCSWQTKYYLDGGTVTSLGSALTTTSGNLNWTVGTSDTGRRLRMRFTATTNGSHVTSTDPKVLRLMVYARSPDQVRAVVMPTDQRNLFETTKILRKLVDAGPITTREPDTNETYTAYFKSANTVWFATDSGYSQGVELTWNRYVVSA